MSKRIFWTASLGVACLLAGVQKVHAVEPAEEFVNALRERGYHDTAIEFLEDAGNNPLIPVAFKQQLAYEIGVTHIEASRTQGDPAIRRNHLEEARKALEQFIGGNPNHPKIDSAKQNLGNLLVERGRILVEQAKKNDNKQLLAEAKQLYQDAYQVFFKAQTDLKEKLEKLPPVYGQNRPEEKERLTAMRSEYLQAQLLSAAILEETADTEADGSDAQKQWLTKAEKEYGEIYEKYRTRLAGLYARMYQGRSHKKMGNHKDALSYFVELLDQPDDPEPFRVLKTKTLLLAIDSWLAEGKSTEAVKKASEWVDKARPHEARDLDWLELRLKLAKALRADSDYLKQKDAKDPQINKHLAQARQEATFVAKYRSPYQDEARKMLTELRGGEDPNAGEKKVATNFEEAKTFGKEAIERMQTSSMVLRMVPPRLQREKDPKIKEELTEQIAAAQEDSVTARLDALDYFRDALRLADSETSADDLNVVRYFLCYLNYMQGDYHDAALLGEFVARRYPDSSGARQSAKIAMASYVKLYTENTEPDKSFEVEGIVDICRYIAETWSEHPEAVEAINTMIPFLIKDENLEVAEQYLTRIPAESQQRAEAEIKLGQAYWSMYLTKASELREIKQNNPDTDDASRQTEMDALLAKAETLLGQGISRLDPAATVNESVATAVLSLSQIYVDNGKPLEAITLLENPNYGALVLVGKKHPSTQREGFDQETYKTALRAYIASLSDKQVNQQKADEMIAKAKGIMDAMKSTVAVDEAGKRRLVAIYISLARDLQRQIELAPPAARVGLSKGFDTFLTQVGNEATEFDVLNWVAETFYGLGQGLDPSTKELSAEAKPYFERAAAAYEKILARGKSQPDFLSAQMAVQVRMRLAMANRRLGKFTDAMDTFVDILTERNMMLDVQIEAARTYQMWASYPGKEELYLSAIRGARPDKTKTPIQNTVWGWNKLARLTSSREQFRDAFHEARYNLALALFEYGKEQKDAGKKKENVSKAQTAIAMTYRLYPELGGEKWRAQYDDLLKQIQRQLGDNTPRGLQALNDKPGSSKAGG